MANIKSAKKQARTSLIKQQRNLSRKTALKTAIKKVLSAIKQQQEGPTIKELFKDAEAKLARAYNKGLLHRNTASRKIGRLAQKVAAATQQSQSK